MKLISKLSVAAFAFSLVIGHGTATFAREGGVATGGGDACEKRIQQIRDDIQDWILRDGHQQLTGLSFGHEYYKQQMLTFLATKKNTDGSVRAVTDIECLDQRVQVDGHEKICRFERFAKGAKITCDARKFLDRATMTDDEQYKLIHHEYAGIAGLEVPTGSQSQYFISNQVVESLEMRQVRMLAVKCKSTSCTGNYPDMRSENFKACFNVYSRSLFAHQVTAACVAKSNFDFLSPNFKACFNIYSLSLPAHNAADMCMAKSNFDFLSPNFKACFNVYSRSLFGHNAADKCVELCK
jgi:hypothetical protein